VRLPFLHIPLVLALAWLSLAPQARAVFACQDGCLGNSNTVLGDLALYSNTTGYENTAIGERALLNNTTGGNNTANGVNALQLNTTGDNNAANGVSALYHNTTGISNIALGFQAGFNLTTGSHNIDIGNIGIAGESNRIRIGTVGAQTAAFIAGIHGVAVTGAGVVVNSNGQLGVAPSSARFKAEIKPMDKASEALFALKPVTFHYKPELDPTGIAQFGLVADEVEKVNPDLVARDADGKPYTVRYEAVNAMLLNEFLKEHKKVEEQATTIAQQRKDFQASITKLEATVAQQQKGMEALAATLKEQAAQIQKVSAQLEVSKSTPQMAGNNQ
jgi:hypothetical protein